MSKLKSCIAGILKHCYYSVNFHVKLNIFFLNMKMHFMTIQTTYDLLSFCKISWHCRITPHTYVLSILTGVKPGL